MKFKTIAAFAVLAMVFAGAAVIITDDGAANAKEGTLALTATQQQDTLFSLEIEQAPDKVNYVAGEYFDPTGMVVIAKYVTPADTVYSVEVTDYVYIPDTELTTEYESVEIIYTDDSGQTAYISQAITVSEPVVVSIEVVSQPSKLKYFVGDYLSTKGMVVVAYYDNGKSAVVKDYKVQYTQSPFVVDGTYPAEVTYGGASTYTADLTVLPNDFVAVWDNSLGRKAMVWDPVKISETNYNDENNEYWFSQDASIKLSYFAGYDELWFYVDNGVTLEVKVTEDFGDKVIHFVTIAGDKAEKTVFTRTHVAVYADKATFEYKAADINDKGSIVSGGNATFYSSYKFTNLLTTGNCVNVAPGTQLMTNLGIEDLGRFTTNSKSSILIQWGIMFFISHDGGWYVILSAPGEEVEDLALSDGAPVMFIQSGTVKVGYADDYITFNSIVGSMGVMLVEGSRLGLIPGFYGDFDTGYLGEITLSSVSSSKIMIAPGFVNNTTLNIMKTANVECYNEDGVVWNYGVMNVRNSDFIYMYGGQPGDDVVVNKGVINAYNKDLWEYNIVDYGKDTKHKTIKGLITLATSEDDVYKCTGPVNTRAISEPLKVISGTFANITVYENQILTVDGDTYVKGELIVYGIVDIVNGVKLTVEVSKDVERAQVYVSGPLALFTNNGSISMNVAPTKATDDAPSQEVAMTVNNYASFYNNGSMATVSKAPATDRYNGVVMILDSEWFSNNGSMNIGSYDCVVFSETYNYGNMSVYGELTEGSIVNYGTLTFSGNATITAGASFDVGLIGKSAVLDIQSLSVYNTLGDQLYVYTNDTVAVISGYYDLAGTEDKTITIKGLTIGAGMNFDGTISVATTGAEIQNVTSTNGEQFVTVAIAGPATVKGALSIPVKVGFIGGDFTVAGTVYANATKANDGFQPDALDVTGHVYGLGVKNMGLHEGKYARYTTAGNGDVYTSLKLAIDEAQAAGVKSVAVGDRDVRGVMTEKVGYALKDNITVPAGMMVTGGTIVINSNVLVERNGVFGFTGIIYVNNGTLVAENAHNINAQDIYSEIMIEDEEGVMYTKIKTLLDNIVVPNDGSVYQIDAVLNGYADEFYGRVNERFTLIHEEDIVIPAGVILNLLPTEDDDVVYLEFAGASLTIDGALVMPEASFYMKDCWVQESSLTVNGYLYNKGTNYELKWWYPAGVHYMQDESDTLTFIDDDLFYVDTCVANIADAVAAAKDVKLTITSSEMIPEVTIAGTEENPAEVTVKRSDFNAEGITLKWASIKMQDSQDTRAVNVVINNENGQITISNAYVQKGDYLKFVEADDMLTMSGTINDRYPFEQNESTYYLLFEGTTAIDGFEADMAFVLEGTPYVDGNIESPVVDVEGYVHGVGRSNTFYTIVTIYGTMNADNLSRINFEQDVYVLGTLSASPRTSEKMAGSIDSEGDIYIGCIRDGVYYPDYYSGTSYGGSYYLSAGATVTGNVYCEGFYFVYVANNATIDEDIIEDAFSIEFQTDYVPYLDVYTTNNKNTKLNVYGLMIPSPNATVDYFLDADDNRFNVYDSRAAIQVLDQALDGIEEKFFVGAGSYFALSNTEEKVVNAVLDKNIFTVNVKTDNSIKEVYIDGMLMRTADDANWYTMDLLAAGKHTIKVVAATGYDASKAVLFDDSGKKITGMVIEFTKANERHEDGYDIWYNVNGTEKVPETVIVENIDDVPTTPETDLSDLQKALDDLNKKVDANTQAIKDNTSAVSEISVEIPAENEWSISTILMLVLVILIALMAVILFMRLNRS